jgi:hypothetical protein
MKKTILFFLILLISVLSYGQAHEGTVEYERKLRPAAVIELPFPHSVVDAAMDDYISKKGKSRSNNIKGFTTFRNTQPLQNDRVNADMYFKTGRKRKKEKEVTVASLLVMPNDPQTNPGHLHYLEMNDVRDYLNGLPKTVEANILGLTIKDENDVVIKAETRYKSLTIEGEDLENKTAAIDKKIADNKNNQQPQSMEIENEKQKLSKKVSQRKS